MKKSKKVFELSGIVPPLVTPLNENFELDVPDLERLLDHVIGGGVSGVFILGTTGEIPRFSFQLKKSVIENTCRLVKGRVPVLVGITDTCMQESIRLEQIASQCGADAVVLAPPFYYHVEQNELLEYFREICGQIELPLYLYNMPSRTHIDIEIGTVLKATEIPGIVGIKDSSGDFIYMQKLLLALKGHPGFSVFVGPEEIMAASVLFGASGGVSGGANMYPELFVNLFKAAREKDFETIYSLQDVVTQISNTLYQSGNGNSNFIKILKEALRQLGICKEIMAKPYLPFSDQEKMEIASCLDKIQIPGNIKVNS